MMSDEHHNKDEKPGWADTEGFRRFFVGLLVVACIGVAAAGFVPAWQKKEPHFAAEGVSGIFFAIYGFVAFSFIVLAGQHLRKLVDAQGGVLR